MFAGDGAHNSAALLPDLLADGIRVLIYAGDQVRFFYKSRPCRRSEPLIDQKHVIAGLYVQLDWQQEMAS